MTSPHLPNSALLHEQHGEDRRGPRGVNPAPDSFRTASVPSPPCFTRGLVPEKDGICYSPAQASCSFPVEGHACCLAVEEESFWFRHRNKAIVALLNAFPPAGFVLDVGGGNGFVSVALERAGFPTVLLEPEPAGARNAMGRGLRRVLCSTVENAGLVDGAVPAAGLFDVLEHVKDPAEFLGRLARALAPGGRLYVSTPALRWLWSREDEVAGHYRRYSMGSLSGELTAAGFRTEYATYLFSYLPLPILLVRTLPSLLGSASRRHAALKEIQTGHRPAGGVVKRLQDLFHGFETAFLRRRWRLPFGSSILLVARKEGRTKA